jgi:hypothetical protein
MLCNAQNKTNDFLKKIYCKQEPVTVKLFLCFIHHFIKAHETEGVQLHDPEETAMVSSGQHIGLAPDTVWMLWRREKCQE